MFAGEKMYCYFHDIKSAKQISNKNESLEDIYKHLNHKN
jgi:hypothetical protein